MKCLDIKFVDVPRGSPVTVNLKKEGTGLGFSLEGGKDSPFGDRPMTVKKIFTGILHSKKRTLYIQNLLNSSVLAGPIELHTDC